MCGITGTYYFEGINHGEQKNQVHKATKQLHSRGPDNTGFYSNTHIILGHSRLPVIDLSEAAKQPFTDISGRYTLVFNGEIYNFKSLRKTLRQQGVEFTSESDTEVLLYWYISKGEKCLEDLCGCFSFAVYDNYNKTLFLARDRYGIKPLYYYSDNDKFVFASEMKALQKYEVPKSIDRSSLLAYLQLNYIPGPWTIFENIRKLSPGHFISINRNKDIFEEKYYSLSMPTKKRESPLSYQKSCKQLHELVETSVTDRLVSDVPLGAFLSGGIDSSIITALAAKHVNNLNTFSIGFKDEPLFDETRYANMVAKMHNTNHTVFNLTNDDLFGSLFDVMNYIDEPFADSSALAFYILSQKTREKATVALSGDGADELFAGYNKHMAEYRIIYPGIKEKITSLLYPAISKLPQSRNNAFLNKIRQAARFGKGFNLNPDDRYWYWCSSADEHEAIKLLKNKNIPEDYYSRKNSFLDIFNGQHIDINNTLYADMHLVLPYDMLTKADLMSMANSLEVRSPFLDHRLVDYVASLPENFKIDKNNRKKILKDTFSYLLPKEIINRSKHGFEVPLTKWFRNELSSFIHNDALEESFIEHQNLFNLKEVNLIKQKLNTSNPGDAPARIWGLIIFQQWWKNYS